MQNTETNPEIPISGPFRDCFATVILRRSRRICSSYVIRKTRSFAAAQDDKTVICASRHNFKGGKTGIGAKRMLVRHRSFRSGRSLRSFKSFI